MYASAEGHHDVAVELITARADVDVQNQVSPTVCSLPWFRIPLKWAQIGCYCSICTLGVSLH